MTIAEQIAALKASKKAAFEAQQKAAKKAADEARLLSAEEQTEVDTLQAEIEQTDADIARFEKMLESEMKNAQPVDKTKGAPGNALHVSNPQAPKAEKGLAFAQYVRTLAQANGVKHVAAQIAAEQAKDGRIDSRVATFAKAAVSGATTDNAGWAGNLVHDAGVVSQDFIDYLRSRTILGQFGQGGVPSLRNGVEGVPVDSQASAASAGWVAEGGAGPVTSWSYSTRKLTAYKLMALCVASNELLRKASTAADVMLRDELARAVAEKEDSTFIGTAAGGSGAPAGILNGAAKQVSNATTGASATAKFEADFAYLVGKIIAAKIPFASVVILMSTANAFALSRIRDTNGNYVYPDIGMNGGSVAKVPVMVSDYVGDTVVLMAANEIYLVNGPGLDVRVSQEASIEMADAPTGNSKTPTGTSLVSMFQTDSTGFLVTESIGWERRRDAAVCYVTSADYSKPNA
jgi:HK97 family phage major capsid protein